MRAYQITHIHDISDEHMPLAEVEIPRPKPASSEVLIRVAYCGVCHTELDEIEGRAAPDKLPRVPGHQAIGEVIECGENADQALLGKRVGVAWISHSCGHCAYCEQGLENLCPNYVATGKDVDGGYAEYMTAHSDFVVEIPGPIESELAAPLLCAGAIGYRSLIMCALKDGQALGLSGFGSSGKIALQLAKLLYPNSPVYVFARSEIERSIAIEQGAIWAGTIDQKPEVLLDAIIDTTPVWSPIVRALECLAPNGKIVVNAISKLKNDQDVLLELNFKQHLWQERSIKSVANVTREDVKACMRLIASSQWRPAIELYPFSSANQALRDLKFQPVKAAKVLNIVSSDQPRN